MAEAEDETTIDTPPTEYGEQITEVAVLLMYLLERQERLSGAICRAKAGLDLSAGLDGEVGLNAKRQEVAAVFRRMAGLRISETLIPNGGTGYRFNNEGNQVAYRCDNVDFSNTSPTAISYFDEEEKVQDWAYLLDSYLILIFNKKVHLNFPKHAII